MSASLLFRHSNAANRSSRRTLSRVSISPTQVGRFTVSNSHGRNPLWPDRSAASVAGGPKPTLDAIHIWLKASGRMVSGFLAGNGRQHNDRLGEPRLLRRDRIVISGVERRLIAGTRGLVRRRATRQDGGVNPLEVAQIDAQVSITGIAEYLVEPTLIRTKRWIIVKDQAEIRLIHLVAYPRAFRLGAPARPGG